jgi:hypothetical protein
MFNQLASVECHIPQIERFVKLHFFNELYVKVLGMFTSGISSYHLLAGKYSYMPT